MKVVGSFNNVSDKLKEELIKPVKPNQIIFLQLLNGSYDPALKREVFGASKSLRLADRVYDPYLTDKAGKEVGGYVDIGVPETIKDGRVEKCKKYWVEAIANGIPGNGQFSLMGGNISDMEVYEFLCLSNGSKTNPHRDKSIQAQYEIVDVEGAKAAQQEKDFKELKAKLAIFSKQNPEKAATLFPKDNKDATT